MSWVVAGETLRRHLNHPGYLITLALFAGAAALAGGVNMVSNPMLSFLEIAVVLIGAQAIGPEFTSGTLQLILTKPVNRSVYLMSRVAGIMMAIWLLTWVPRLIELIFRLGAGQKVDFLSFLGRTVNLSIEPLIVVSILVLFGALTRSYMNVACYFLLSMIMGLAVAGSAEARRTTIGGIIGAIGRFLNRHPWIDTAIRAVHDNVFPNLAGETLQLSAILLVVSNSAVALLAASLIFRRREVPYGAD